MARIDFYVTHLLRHNALAVEITSAQPVKFRFPTGDRKTNQTVDHATLVELVQEVAPRTALDELRRKSRCTFVRPGSGIDLVVTVEALGAASWRAKIEPAQAEPDVESIPSPVPAAPTPAEIEPILHRPGEKRSIMPPKVELAPGEPKINRALREMVRLGASDLHLSSRVEPMIRKDGEMQVLEKRAPLRSEELEVMIREILPESAKVEWASQDVDFAHTIEGLARFRANVFWDRKGIGAVFRQIPFQLLTVEQLGLGPKVIDLCWLTKGLVLVTGPTGSGKSTTMAALIDFINQNRADHIITIEDPIEFVHENKKCLVNQREIRTHTKGWKSALRAALREDPDVVLVGEMRDLETISIAIETAETGHLVFGTLHTTSATSTIDRIIDQFPADRQEQIRVMLSESLRGVIAQVLCKKKSGGRVAAHEILISNSAVANMIREGKTFQLASVMQTGKSLGMQTMNEHLLAHVKSGVVDAEEAYMRSNDKLAFKDLLQKNNIPLRL
jgi:twitching motility protein PilT